MKAAVYKRYGGPEVVHIEEVPTPVIRANEILVRIKYSTVNRTDAGFRSAEYFISRFWSGLLKPKMPILGCEFSGVVDQVASDVTKFKVGDKVFGYNDSTFGTHAEYIVIAADGLVRHIPDNIDFKEAAALTEGSHYALADLYAGKIKPGQHWLINGGTGAIGSAAVSLAAHFGALVTAVCATEDIELVKSRGADVVMDYLKEDFTNSDKLYDVVFDAVGKSSFGKCKKILKPGGKYISTELGANAENVWLAIWGKIVGGKRVLFPIPIFRQEDLDLLLKLASSGEFTPLMDRTYELDDIVEAHRFVDSGKKKGNVTVHIAD